MEDVKNNTSVCSLYLRVSTSHQETEMQRRELRAEAKSLNLTIHAEYEDVISGSKASRSGLEALKRDAQVRKFGVILIWRVDRLSRILRDGLNMFEELESQYGLTIRFLKEPHLNTGAPGYKMARNLVLIGAEMELGAITQRVRSGKLAWLKSGKWASSSPPYGYKIDQGHSLTIEPKAAAIVRRIFTLYAVKSYGCRAIAEMLNEENIPSPKGIQWQRSSLLRIVSNQTYTGRHTAGRALEKVEQHFTPIVSQELFDRAQEMKAVKLTYGPKNVHRNYLFRGIIKCAKCGFSLSGRVKRIRGKEYMYYHGKPGGTSTNRCQPTCGMISQDKILRTTCTALLETLADMSDTQIDKLLDATTRSDSDTQAALQEAQDALKALGSRRDRVLELYMAGEIDKKRREVELRKLNEKQRFFMDKVTEFADGQAGERERDGLRSEFKETVEKLRGQRRALPIGRSRGKASGRSAVNGDKASRDRAAMYGYMGSLLESGVIGKVYVDFARGELHIYHARPGLPKLTGEMVNGRLGILRGDTTLTPPNHAGDLRTRSDNCMIADDGKTGASQRVRNGYFVGTDSNGGHATTNGIRAVFADGLWFVLNVQCRLRRRPQGRP